VRLIHLGTCLAEKVHMPNAKVSSVAPQTHESVPDARGSEKGVHGAEVRPQRIELDRKPVDSEAGDPYDNVACTD
jgi:hypothetical protein